MRVPILERLASGDILIADGATGTMLQELGCPPGCPARHGFWSSRRRYQAAPGLPRAGSQIILTTTFGGTRARLKAAGLDPR